MNRENHYKLIFYVPDSHLKVVKEALFAAGAGALGNYRRCSWKVLGEGSFQPMDGSNPYSGEVGLLTRVPEWRVEILVTERSAKSALRALLETHPYEEPAYEFIQISSITL